MKYIKAIASFFLSFCILCSCGGNGADNGSTETNGIGVTEKVPAGSYNPEGNEIDVKKYGAAGDGTGDDTAAVNAALEKAKETGGILYFPEGVYRLTESVAVNSDVSVAFADGAVINTEKTFRVTTVVIAGNHRIFGEGNFKCILRNEYVNPMWFGAVGDGVTDDTAAFEKALESGSSLGVPFTAGGFAVGGLNLKKSAVITGIPSENGERARLVGIKNRDMFTFSTYDISISGFDIDMSDSGKAAVFFYDTSAAGKSGYHLYDIDITGAYRVIRDAAVITNYVINSLVENVNCYAGRGTAFDLRCFWGFVFFRDLVIDYTETAEKYGIKPDFPAVILENNAGCVFQRMKIVGDGNKSNGNAHAFQYRNDIATWMDGCEFLNITGNCVNVSGASSHLYFSNLKSSGCIGDAFSFTTVIFLQVHGLEISGGRNGIMLNQCNGAQITGCDITGVTGDGILNYTSNGTSVVGCSVSQCGGRGYSESSAMGSAIVDCIFTDCRGGGLIIGQKSGAVSG